MSGLGNFAGAAAAVGGVLLALGATIAILVFAHNAPEGGHAKQPAYQRLSSRARLYLLGCATSAHLGMTLAIWGSIGQPPFFAAWSPATIIVTNLGLGAIYFGLFTAYRRWEAGLTSPSWRYVRDIVLCLIGLALLGLAA